MKKIKKALSFALTAALVITSLLPVTAFAEEQEASAPRVEVEVANFNGSSMNLTEEGDYDWIFVGNRHNQDALPSERKLTATGEAADIIQYGYLKDTNLCKLFLE